MNLFQLTSSLQVKIENTGGTAAAATTEDAGCALSRITSKHQRFVALCTLLYSVNQTQFTQLPQQD